MHPVGLGLQGGARRPKLAASKRRVGLKRKDPEAMAAYCGGLDGWVTGGGARGRARIGLVTHAASLNAGGVHSIDLVAHAAGRRLRAIFTPEHGLFGSAGAGEDVESSIHPDLGVPVHSLYGAHRRPTPGMLEGLDLLIFDLQDIGVRCYTYVSTLRAVMETAAAAGLPLLVADRPIPLAHAVDGPMLDPEHESFVGCIPAPLVYAMTPAETARWLRATLRLDLDLRIAPLHGWMPGEWPAGQGAPPWVPPSPGIRTWDAARAYAATVFSEALPAIDCDRGGLLPFQVFCGGRFDAAGLCRRLSRMALPGVRFHPHRIRSVGAAIAGAPGMGRKKERRKTGKRKTEDEVRAGVRMTVTDPRVFRPVLTGVALLHAAAAAHGVDAIWAAPGVRESFFDQLAGTARLRADLKAGRSPRAIAAGWARDTRAFLPARDAALLYSRQPRG